LGAKAAKRMGWTSLAEIKIRAMKTIIFDFGNVVGFFDHGRTLEKLRPFSPLTSAEMFALVYESPLEDRVERGLLTVPAFLQEVRQLWRLGCDTEFLAQTIGDIFTPNAEVCELIPLLAKRYRILLGSNTNAIHSGHFLTQFADVLSHFDSLVLSHEIGTRKPDAEFFLHCHQLADAHPAECVFVDDLPKNIDGARAVGFHGILYKPNANLAEHLRSLGVEV
jgi:FMN phosphatase YigB (HAD superfamily)